MKTQTLLLSMLFTCFASAQFAPVPMLQNKPWRMFIGGTESIGFNSFKHSQAELKAALIHTIHPGFDTGVALHGGFGASSSYPGVMGVDFMGRYVNNWNSFMFGGIQIIAGYTYNGIGLSNRNNTVASTIPITFGPVIGYKGIPGTLIYMFPALEFGRKNYATEQDLWGTQVGIQVGFGAAIKLWGPLLSIDIRPRYTSQNQFGLDMTAGLVWNF